ncbi:copper chaperone for superoxide dismutase [Lates japonicus]|uniref:Copper chaperone for superoxide dismutase n=1 Tax=Lates japonicus TaxID=270547 RepID=A0AAD3MFQ7_LATJO|nr:copper chaperone for superoxide dismutase [Lates japonicus]
MRGAGGGICWPIAEVQAPDKARTPRGGTENIEDRTGDLGNIDAGPDGRDSFRLEETQLKVWDVIGRSLVVDAGEDDLGRGSHPLSKHTGNSGERQLHSAPPPPPSSDYYRARSQAHHSCIWRHGPGNHTVKALRGQPGVGRTTRRAVGHLEPYGPGGQLQACCGSSPPSTCRRGARPGARHPGAQWARSLGRNLVVEPGIPLLQAMPLFTWKTKGKLQAAEALPRHPHLRAPTVSRAVKVQPSKQAPGKIPVLTVESRATMLEVPVGSPLEQYQEVQAVLAPLHRSPPGFCLYRSNKVCTIQSTTPHFPIPCAALTGSPQAARSGNPVNPAVYGARARSGGATQRRTLLPLPPLPTDSVYTPTVANPHVPGCCPGLNASGSGCCKPAYTVAQRFWCSHTSLAHKRHEQRTPPQLSLRQPGRCITCPRPAGCGRAAGGGCCCSGSGAGVTKSRRRTAVLTVGALLPDPVVGVHVPEPNPALLSSSWRGSRRGAVRGLTEDPMTQGDFSAFKILYYVEYYQQLQQYPQFQYAYPTLSTVTAIPGMPAVPAVPAMSAQPVATLDALRPVVPTAAAVAAAMAAPRVYEPPLPPPTRKEAILRRPELSLHTPEPPFR